MSQKTPQGIASGRPRPAQSHLEALAHAAPAAHAAPVAHAVHAAHAADADAAGKGGITPPTLSDPGVRP